MKAVFFEQTGDADQVLVFGEKSLPQLGANDVLVRLSTSGVNPSDIKKRAGLQPPGFQDGFVIPHSDGAGVIEAVGEAVSNDRVGQRVWVYQAQFARHMGTAAQYVVLANERACLLPDCADFDIGACLGIPVMTAHRCVDLAGGVKDQTVLVTGASGRVGFYAAQWAKLAGAKVIGTAGSPERLEHAGKAGCDLLLNYQTDDVVSSVMEFTNGAGVDRIIDVEFGLNVESSVQMLKVNGVIASYSSSKDPQPVVPFYALMFKNITLRTVLVYNMPELAKQAAIDAITTALDGNHLKHCIAQTYSLENTAAAHQTLEAGNITGCVVVRI